MGLGVEDRELYSQAVHSLCKQVVNRKSLDPGFRSTCSLVGFEGEV